MRWGSPTARSEVVQKLKDYLCLLQKEAGSVPADIFQRQIALEILAPDCSPVAVAQFILVATLEAGYEVALN